MSYAYSYRREYNDKESRAIWRHQVLARSSWRKLFFSICQQLSRVWGTSKARGVSEPWSKSYPFSLLFLSRTPPGLLFSSLDRRACRVLEKNSRRPRHRAFNLMYLRRSACERANERTNDGYGHGGIQSRPKPTKFYVFVDDTRYATSG